jgi:hypothetical protein
MRHLNAKQSASMYHAASIKNCTPIVYPFCEQDILDLHHKFLTPGFHTLTTNNHVMQTLLDSLNYHQNILVLTMKEPPITPAVTDLYSVLDESGYLQPLAIDTLDEFFINSFFYDFMWIEATTELLSTPWYMVFEHKLHEFNIDRQIPIILMDYEDNINR